MHLCSYYSLILTSSVERSYIFVLFNQKTAYELLISDWSSDVCSSDLACRRPVSINRHKSLSLAKACISPRLNSDTFHSQTFQLKQGDKRDPKDRKSVVRERVCQYV